MVVRTRKKAKNQMTTRSPMIGPNPTCPPAKLTKKQNAAMVKEKTPDPKFPVAKKKKAHPNAPHNSREPPRQKAPNHAKPLQQPGLTARKEKVSSAIRSRNEKKRVQVVKESSRGETKERKKVQQSR